MDGGGDLETATFDVGTDDRVKAGIIKTDDGIDGFFALKGDWDSSEYLYLVTYLHLVLGLEEHLFKLFVFGTNITELVRPFISSGVGGPGRHCSVVVDALSFTPLGDVWVTHNGSRGGTAGL